MIYLAIGFVAGVVFGMFVTYQVCRELMADAAMQRARADFFYEQYVALVDTLDSGFNTEAVNDE